MFSINNIEKYLEDNPEKFPNKEEIIAKARKFLVEDSNMLVGYTAQEVFGQENAKIFLSTIVRDKQHQRIFDQDLPTTEAERAITLTALLKKFSAVKNTNMRIRVDTKILLN